jgi:hypothetical protein
MFSSSPSGNGNGKLEALRRREAALKAAIAEERVRQQKREEKDAAKLHAIIGAALARYAGQSPAFKQTLQQMLHAAELRDTERAFLAGKGWL